MITSFTVTNDRKRSKKFTLRNPYPDGIFIKNIKGLGPADVQLSQYDHAAVAGSKITGSRVGARNIVFTLGFAPTNGDVEASRLISYSTFPVGTIVRMEFVTEHQKVEIYGWVETNEPDIFNENVTSTVSVMCPSPYFMDLTNGQSIFTTPSGFTDASFEFPFENPSLNTRMIEFSNSSSTPATAQVLVQYAGDGIPGVIYELTCLGSAPIPNIWTADLSLDIRGAYRAVKGQVYQISTIPGNKYVRRLEGTNNVNSWGFIAPSSKLAPLPREGAIVYSNGGGNWSVKVLLQEYRNGILWIFSSMVWGRQIS